METTIKQVGLNKLIGAGRLKGRVFCFTLPCGSVLPAISGWQFLQREFGVHAKDKYACKICTGVWTGNSEPGGMMLVVYSKKSELEASGSTAQQAKDLAAQGSVMGPTFEQANKVAAPCSGLSSLRCALCS